MPTRVQTGGALQPVGHNLTANRSTCSPDEQCGVEKTNIKLLRKTNLVMRQVGLLDSSFALDNEWYACRGFA